MTSWLTVRQNTAPLIISLPHTGTDLADIEGAVVSQWLARKDCDWWIDRLYDFAEELGTTIVHTAISRTVIDVNRDPSGASLYPGQTTTGLCPTETFDGEPLYKAGFEPSPSEIDRRRAVWFEPYHAAIGAEIARLRGLHERIVLYDCHSIRSVLPRLFDGTLPVFNLGTNDGRACDPLLQEKVAGIMAATGESWIVNGRFKGGWTTRHYGRPESGVHAIQMELAQSTHLATEAPPFDLDPAKAEALRQPLAEILARLDALAPELAR